MGMTGRASERRDALRVLRNERNWPGTGSRSERRQKAG